jgi:hypothetical protein
MLSYQGSESSTSEGILKVKGKKIHLLTTKNITFFLLIYVDVFLNTFKSV